MDTDQRSFPIEGAYMIIDWLLHCTAHVDNIINPLHALLQDALHRQDEEL